MDLRKLQQWRHPWTSIIAGPTGCGKSVFVEKFLRDLSIMSDTKFARILFYFGEWQPGYAKQFGNSIEFHEGLPDKNDNAFDYRPKLIIIDDLMRESSNKVIVDLFTKGSHHRNISVMYLTQNIFHQGRGQRDISLNANYVVLFKNPRDGAQFHHLARQVYPENPKFLREAYSDATSKPHGYLLLDLKQSTPDEYRYRTCIFPSDSQMYIYVPKKHLIKRNV